MVLESSESMLAQLWSLACAAAGRNAMADTRIEPHSLPRRFIALLPIQWVLQSNTRA
jgi:hypothetical protein